MGKGDQHRPGGARARSQNDQKTQGGKAHGSNILTSMMKEQWKVRKNKLKKKLQMAMRAQKVLTNKIFLQFPKKMLFKKFIELGFRGVKFNFKRLKLVPCSGERY
jgi:hypothetical protein